MLRLHGPPLSTRLESGLYRIAIYAIPVVLALASLAALMLLPGQYPANPATRLSFPAFQSPATINPDAARAKLLLSPVAQRLNTRLSEDPVWLQIELPADPVARIVELPSRHATSASCWHTRDLTPIGNADRSASSGRLWAAKTGFAFDAPANRSISVLCRTTATGPAYITAQVWSRDAFEVSEYEFHRNTGLLDGGLIVLSLFVLTTALINREWLYVLFAVWLVANLRLAAISAGWDTQWLEHTIPPVLHTPLRKFTTAAYYILTLLLFGRLFADDLKQRLHTILLRIGQWSCVPLLAAVVFLPYHFYLPVLWALTAGGGSMLVFLLIRILIQTRSPVAAWYGAGIAVALVSSLNEVVAAALGFRELIGSINSVTAALASSLLAALAIAEQIRSERLERRKAQEALAATYNALPVGLFSLDDAGLILQCNPAYTRMLDRAPGGHWADDFEPGTWERLQKMVADGADEMEINGRPGGAGEKKAFLLNATRGDANHIEGSLQDITLRVEATARLAFLADHDPLTGTLNRRGIERVFNDAATTLPPGATFALAYLDLDRFKLINDLFGHIAGDMVLRQVCDRLQRALGPGEILGRVGGDEFVVVFPAGRLERAVATSHGLIAAIAKEPYAEGERAFHVKCSIGLVEVGEGIGEDDAVSLADRACREAKRQHEGNLVVYQRDMAVFSEHRDELRLIHHLGKEELDGLYLQMQPIMSLRDPYGSLNFEVLLRMRDPSGAIVPAWRLIPAAERNGRIAAIDKWVLTQTLRWIEKNLNHLQRSSYVSVNLSGGSLNDENFIAEAFAILGKHEAAVQKLCIEITESVALHDLANTQHFINGVRRHGARVALDDFGAGYTSFNYLRSLPADAIKIDGAYVKDLLAHPANQSIVQAIVDLTRNLGMKCTAEWAEDVATLEALAEMGVDYVQGFVVSQPLDPDQILLANSAADFIQDPLTTRFIKRDLPAILERADTPGAMRYH